MLEISIREMNQNFSRYLQAVEAGEVIITRRGKPAAKLVAISELKKLTEKQRAARARSRKRMMRGYHLGGERIKREDIYERQTDYD